MAVKLYGVFSPCIAVGGARDHGHALVNGPSLDSPQLAQHPSAGLGSFAKDGKRPFYDFHTAFPESRRMPMAET